MITDEIPTTVMGMKGKRREGIKVGKGRGRESWKKGRKVGR